MKLCKTNRYIRDRIDLENVIFYQAALQQALLWARAGKLHVSRANGFLIQLVRLYNFLYEQHNKRFLKEDIRWQRGEMRAFAADYYKDLHQNRPKDNFKLDTKKHLADRRGV